MSNISTIKSMNTTTTLYLVNNPHVDGRVVYNAMIDVLKMKSPVAQKKIMEAHTKGLIELSDVTTSQASAIITFFNDYMEDQGYLQKVLVQSSDLSLVQIQAQDKNDVVRRLVVLPEEAFLPTNARNLLE